MTQLRFTQEWVNKMATGTAGDFNVSGVDVEGAPSIADVSEIIKKVSGADAVREMVRRKWFLPEVSDSPKPARIKALQDFLFPHLSSRPMFSGAALFRRQSRQRDFVADMTTLAWLCRVTDRAADKVKYQFDPSKIDRAAITRLVHFSRKDTGPLDAIAYLERLGVRVIIESTLPSMQTDGASFIASKSYPVIGLTLRYDRLDNFWFTLLHELGHIVLHLCDHPDEVFVDSIEDEDRSESEIEAEANAFAKDAFIPRDVWLRSEAYRFGKESAIINLAEKFDIHPAVIAGRLRFERRKYAQHSHLLGSGQVRSTLLAE